jgi:metal-responsive CopG/Arc/MetJ family transcriptional regulator
MKKEYMAVTVPKELIPIIDITIEGKGHTSRAEFIKYCVRKELARITKE